MSLSLGLSRLKWTEDTIFWPESNLFLDVMNMMVKNHHNIILYPNWSTCGLVYSPPLLQTKSYPSLPASPLWRMPGMYYQWLRYWRITMRMTIIGCLSTVTLSSHGTSYDLEMDKSCFVVFLTCRWNMNLAKLLYYFMKLICQERDVVWRVQICAQLIFCS